MTQEALLHLDGATEGTTQWKAHILQLVNWGGFEGHHMVVFSPTASLLSGASGTGKSSLLDAYIALMMPSDTPFNGASNDATTGRARSEEQRNLISYLRGKLDTGRETGSQDLRDQVLRGRDTATWGALAMTFAGDHGRRYTALRAYKVPRGAHRSADVIMKMAVIDGDFDLRDLEPLVSGGFDRGELKTRFPGILPFRTYAEYSQTLYTRLGIGAGGDGAKALRLLARIQTGEQVKSVDGLYKTMVLEPPATFLAADKAVGHFADLERAYEAMLTEGQKAQALERITGLHDAMVEARDRADAITGLGADRDGPTPYRLWGLAREDRLLTEATAANQLEAEDARQRFNRADEEKRALKDRLHDLDLQIRRNGGDALDKLQRELADLAQKRDDTSVLRETFDRRTQALGAVVRSAQEYEQIHTDAAAFMTSFPDTQKALTERKKDEWEKSYPLKAQLKELQEESSSLAGRDGLVPAKLHAARLQIAQKTKIPVKELPFVAELIDLASGEELWRTAAEVTLGSVTRILLVDERRLQHLSRTIDELRLPVRISFQGVPLRPYRHLSGDPGKISGKLTFKESPFSHWVQDRVQAANIDAVCVHGPQELAGGGRRVTVNGQTRHGSRGAHGDHGPNIIGFSNQARLAEIDRLAGHLQHQLDALEIQQEQTDTQAVRLETRKDAYRFVLDTAWPRIDVAAVESAIKAKEEEQARILASTDILRQLRAEHDACELEHQDAQRRWFAAEGDLDRLDAARQLLTGRQEAVAAQINTIETRQQTTLNLQMSALLDSEFARVGGSPGPGDFSAALTRLTEHLAQQASDARGRERNARDSLESIFRNYRDRWPDPNLGTAIASYQTYRDILADIQATGLHQRRTEWKRRLSQWSGEDLVPLNGAFDTSVEEIEDRLHPVNAILAQLPFGTNRERLKIDVRRLPREDITTFRKELKRLASGVTEDLTDEQTEARFTRLRAFMQQIRRPEPGSKASSQRDLLLDVRKHVEITAIQMTTDGREICTYSALGGKSGGETQELVAFIVGAALRFQLGDESRTRPRFAPVILDEGFVKADPEFAGRAVNAWKGLGFQLIIGAPLDKVTALEPHMDLMLAMTKNAAGFSYITPLTPTSSSPGTEPKA